MNQAFLKLSMHGERLARPNRFVPQKTVAADASQPSLNFGELFACENSFIR